jgi:type IV secretory pathway TraG/TraD family ATPase VirD4
MRISVELFVAMVLMAIALGTGRTKRGSRDNSASFARRRVLQQLSRRAIGAAGLDLGRVASARWRKTHQEVVSPSRQSMLILGPTQSGKTSSLVIPALLRWEGPVVAASVKNDLVQATAAHRRSVGLVGVFDPNFAAPELAIGFDPVLLSQTWSDARRVASSLLGSSSSEGNTNEIEFWNQLGGKFVAPLFLAAAREGHSFATVCEWIDHRNEEEPLAMLTRNGQRAAADALLASLDRDERQRSSIYATVEAALDPLRIEGIAPRRFIDPREILRNGETLYLCAPAHDQHRYRSAFSAVTNEILHAAFSLAREQGGTLRRPLLVVLDEAAAIAPLRELDVIAATCASHGITLVTCFQDLAQIRARYGERWATVVNNHRTRVFLSGLADPNIDGLLSALSGNAVTDQRELNSAPKQGFKAPSYRPLIESSHLRAMPEHRGIVICGRLPPFRLALIPWWDRKELALRGPARIAGYARFRDQVRRLGSALGHRSDTAV